MATSFQMTPRPVTADNKEFNSSNLYLFQMASGQNRNEFVVTSSKDPANPKLGDIAVNNWVIRDGPDPSGPIVARAQGLHILAGNWNNVFSIVFEDKSFSGSTLEVQGVSVDQGEYAIVGGTGKFAMARGVIYKTLHKRTSDGDIIQLTIRGFFPELARQPVPVPVPVNRPVTKLGPVGGDDGNDSIILVDSTTSRLEEITLWYYGVMDAIQFSFGNQSTTERLTTPMLGGNGGKNTKKITLAPGVSVTQLSGTVGYIGDKRVIRTFRILTDDPNDRNPPTYGYPRTPSDPFTIDVPSNKRIVGFTVRSGNYVSAIGVYVQDKV